MFHKTNADIFFTEFILKYVIPCRDSELRPDLTEGSTSKSSKKNEETAKCTKSILHNWDEISRRYAKSTKSFDIVGTLF